MRGVYYHVGKRHPIATTAIEEADHGILTVTSSRVIYTGNLQSVENPSSKLLALRAFTDG
jgi:hypothetical protein